MGLFSIISQNPSVPANYPPGFDAASASADVGFRDARGGDVRPPLRNRLTISLWSERNALPVSYKLQC